MKIALISIIAIVAAVGGFLVISEPATTTVSESEDVSSQTTQYSDIAREVAEGTATLIDTRTPEEFAEGHAPDAELFSLQRLQAGELPEASKEEKIYVYCRSGNRSAEAAAILTQAGFENVVDLGGLTDIQALGATLVR